MRSAMFGDLQISKNYVRFGGSGTNSGTEHLLIIPYFPRMALHLAVSFTLGRDYSLKRHAIIDLIVHWRES